VGGNGALLGCSTSCAPWQGGPGCGAVTLKEEATVKENAPHLCPSVTQQRSSLSLTLSRAHPLHPTATPQRCTTCLVVVRGCRWSAWTSRQRGCVSAGCGASKHNDTYLFNAWVGESGYFAPCCTAAKGSREGGGSTGCRQAEAAGVGKGGVF